MPADPADQSSQPAVEGEREVDAWLQSLPNNWAPIQPIITASKENIEQSLKDFISMSLKMLWFLPFGPSALNANVPPTVLRNALLGSGADPKGLRKDIADIYDKMPLARLLLLACTEPEVKEVSMTEEERALALMDAWKQKYEGGALDNFLESVKWYEENYDPETYYGRIIPILQSSGTGKSRMIDQLSSVHPVFTVVFRKTDEMIEGWPPRDPFALRFFEDHSSTDPATPHRVKEIRGEEMAAAFLGALVGAIADEWDISLLKGDRAKFSFGLLGTPEAARRDRFFKLVYDRATSMLRDADAFLVEKRRWIHSLRKSPQEGAPMTDVDKYDKELTKSSPDWHCQLFEKFCQPGFERLSAKLHAVNETKFFLALDECTILGQTSAYERAPSRSISLIAVQRILKAAECLKTLVTFIFTILDTTSSATMLHLSDSLGPSSRLIVNLQMLPPFTSLDFNQMRNHMVRATAADSLELENLKYLGRPLWSTSRSSMIVTAAKQKLFADEQFSPVRLNQVLAAFSSRACLKLAGNDAANRIAADAVSHHMRILVSIAKETLVTTVPSEPILAIAAADALNASTRTYNDALQTLFDELDRQNSVLGAGEVRELCCRLLLLLTRDVATTNSYGTFVGEGKRKNTLCIHAIELSKLLSTLIGKEKDTFKKKDQLALAKQLYSLCDGKFLNFHHFIQYEKTIEELTLEELEHAWFSGAAIQCCHNQAVVDVLLLHFDGPLDEPFDARRIGLIAIQIKARSQQADKAVEDGLTVPPILHPNADGSGFKRVKPPTIVLLMDLSAEANFHDTQSRIRLKLRAAESNTKWSGYVDEEPENFLINVRGCSALQYPVLQQFSEPFGTLFKTMTATQPPPELKALENRMMAAMYPIGRLRTEPQLESGESGKNVRDRKSEKNKAKTPGEGADDAEGFPSLRDMREALPPTDSA